MPEITRGQTEDAVPFVFGNTQTNGPAIDVENYAFGNLLLPSGFDVGNFTFQVSEDGVTWYTVNDSAGAAVSIVSVASASLRIPDEVFPAKFFRIVSDTAMTADRACLAKLSG